MAKTDASSVEMEEEGFEEERLIVECDDELKHLIVGSSNICSLSNAASCWKEMMGVWVCFCRRSFLEVDV